MPIAYNGVAGNVAAHQAPHDNTVPAGADPRTASSVDPVLEQLLDIAAFLQIHAWLDSDGSHPATLAAAEAYTDTKAGLGILLFVYDNNVGNLVPGYRATPIPGGGIATAQTMPACHLKQLRVEAAAGPQGAGQDFTVYKNGAPTTLKATLADAGGGGIPETASDLVNVIAFAAGDTFELVTALGGGGTFTASNGVRVSILVAS
jgi:hypothetical protein